MDIIEKLKAFRPWNAQEAADRAEILRRLQNGEPLYDRSNPSAHLTASAWVVNSDRTLVLMAHHDLYHSWAWLGGHADGAHDLLSVAIREVLEESGLCKVRPVSEDIFSVEILTVNGHEKNGLYVPSHLHLNVTFLLEADSAAPLQCKPDENSRVAWFPPGDAVNASAEPWFRQHIYSKLNEKMDSF